MNAADVVLQQLFAMIGLKGQNSRRLQRLLITRKRLLSLNEARISGDLTDGSADWRLCCDLCRLQQTDQPHSMDSQRCVFVDAPWSAQFEPLSPSFASMLSILLDLTPVWALLEETTQNLSISRLNRD